MCDGEEINMVYLSEKEKLFYRNKEKVLVKCDYCGKEFKILYVSAQMNFKKNGRHLCAKCKSALFPRKKISDEARRKISESAKKSISSKPQCSKEFWTEEKKKAQSITMKNSEKYKEAKKGIDISGEKNGMFGKRHSSETRAKMSKARTGKVGSAATAWKGGKASITRKVKRFINNVCKWYYNVFKRDGWKCTICGAKDNIDAHHIKPIVLIIKELCSDKYFNSEQEKYDWLITQDELLDPELTNGITLCRKHHRERHNNWGSHTNPNEKKKE